MSRTLSSIMLLLKLIIWSITLIDVICFTSTSGRVRNWHLPSDVVRNNNNKDDHHHYVSIFRSSNNDAISKLCLALSSTSSSSLQDKNEFSRKVQPDRVLKRRGGGNTLSEYPMEIIASNEECNSLANRFDISNIAQLYASMTLRADSMTQSSSSNVIHSIEVEGTINAKVTRRCVRTNELFEIDIETPFFSIVRSVTPMNVIIANAQSSNKQQEEDLLKGMKGSNNKKSSTSKNQEKRNERKQNKNNFLDEFDVQQLQSMLQYDISNEDDILIEDEAIYPTDGLFDVGELGKL